MRAAFRVANMAVASRQSTATTASTSSSIQSLVSSNTILKHGYASKATQPPTPPSSSGSGSSSATASSSKPVTKNPNSESTPADPERFKDAVDIPGHVKTGETPEKIAAEEAISTATGKVQEVKEDAVNPLTNESPAHSTPLPSTEAPSTTAANTRAIGKEIAPTSGLASQYLDRTEVPMSAEEAAQRTGARARGSKHSLSSIEKKRRMYGRVAIASTLVGAGVVAWHMGREWDSEREKERIGRDVTVEEGLTGRLQRTQARFKDTMDYFNKPAFDPLLPDPLPPPHQKPYTLVLSLDDLLIHSTWDREHGWRTAKRPGVDYFLAYLSQFYEIVLFTAQPSYTAMPIVDKLDPHMIFIIYRLYRDATRFYNKTIIKDLSYLNRDLSKVIMLDTNPEHFQLQPENAYALPPWTGNRNDTDLVGMIPFLEAIAIYRTPDVRPVLKRYADKHIPTAWAEVEREQKRQVLKEWEAEQEKNKGKLSGGGFASLFGLGGQSAPTVGARGGPPKTHLEQQRELYQRSYMEEQKYWAEHREEIEKSMEEERQKAMAQMQSSVLNFFGAYMGLQPPPNDAQPAPQQQQQTIQDSK